jgi:hypothetical protein
VDDLQPSPMKNMTGGAGCGCGCLGLLVSFAGGLALAAGPLGFYASPTDAPFAVGVGAIVVGVLVFGLGGIVYLGSLFLD